MPPTIILTTRDGDLFYLDRPEFPSPRLIRWCGTFWVFECNYRGHDRYVQAEVYNAD